MKCACERYQILNELTGAEGVDLYGLKWQSGRCLLQLFDQRVQVAAGAHQNGDAARRLFGARRLYDFDNALGLSFVGPALGRLVAGVGITVAADDRMDRDAGLRGAALVRDRRRIDDGADHRIVLWRKHIGKGVVYPVDDLLIGTVVEIELQMLREQIAQAVLFNAQEEPDVRFAEAVNRLHRVADQKDRAFRVLFPASGESFQEFDLRGAGVLKFINEQMT